MSQSTNNKIQAMFIRSDQMFARTDQILKQQQEELKQLRGENTKNRRRLEFN